MMPNYGAQPVAQDDLTIALAQLEAELQGGQAGENAYDPGMTQGMPVPGRNPQFAPQQPTQPQPVPGGMPPEQPIPIDEAPNAEEVFALDRIPPEGGEPLNALNARALYYTDALTAGAWPYIAAWLRQQSGYDQGLDYDTLRRQEQGRVREASDFLGETESTVGPFIAPAAGIGILSRGAKSAKSLGKRSAVGGGAYGTTSGYLEGEEPDTLDVGSRIPNALVGGLTGAAVGYGGGRGAGEIADRLSRRTGRSGQGQPAQRASQGETQRMPAAERRLAIERGREAVEGTPRLPAAVEGAPYRKIEDLPVAVRNQLLGRERPHFEAKYGANSKQWRAHVRDTIADHEMSRRRALETETRLQEGGVPEFNNLQEKIAVIVGMYQGGRTLNQIASSLGETGEQVAQTLLRAPQVLGRGRWKIEIPGSLPESGGGQTAANILRTLTQNPTDQMVVPHHQVRAVLGDAQNLMNDVALYRRASSTGGPRGPQPTEIDRGTLPQTSTAPAAPSSESLPAPSAPQPQTAPPPTQLGKTAKPKAEGAKTPKRKPRAKKPPAADKLTRRQRQIGRERYMQFLDETGRKKPAALSLTEDQIMHGWRIHEADAKQAIRSARPSPAIQDEVRQETPRQRPARKKRQKADDLTQDQRISRQAQSIPASEREAAEDAFIEWYTRTHNGRMPDKITDRDLVFGHTRFLVERDKARANIRNRR